MLPNCAASCARYGGETHDPPPASFYDLSAETASGERVDFASYRGKVSLITNVASY